MSRIKLSLLVVAAITLSGCYNHRLTVGAGTPKGRIVYEEWHSYYVLGAFGDPQIDLDKVCPSGNATISRSVSFGNELARIFTLGLYSPTTLTIRCATAKRTDK